MAVQTSSLAHGLSRFRPILVHDLIRLGRNADGGYVVSARTIDRADVLVGLGISDEWSFEEAFAERRPDANIYAVDGTVSLELFDQRRTASMLQAAWSAVHARRWLTMDHAANAGKWREKAASFRRLFLKPRRHFINAMIREEPSSGTTWPQLMARIDRDNPSAANKPRLFVKMDIEGSEYRVLPAVLADAARVTGMAIEFHDTDLLWERLDEQLDRLLQDFVVVHVHANNYVPLSAGSTLPRSLEVTFANRALIEADELSQVNDRQYPLPGLDHPNAADLPDLPLDFD